ncbi:trypsin-like peptidase domain-containing protein [Geodermatophilus sp. SYSU D00766]
MALDRVVAVVATLADGREQVGSGFLVSGRVVLTAAHCTYDKATGQQPDRLRVIRAVDGQSTDKLKVLPHAALDVAALRLANAPWKADLPSVSYARVDRSRSGVLRDCVCIGYPLFQYDPGLQDRRTAELHGVIYQTDEAETGRLLLREPMLTTVGGPTTPPEDGQPTPWGGLSGAVVFHQGRGLGVVVEHHPRQGTAAVQLVAFDQLAGATDVGARAVAAAVSLPSRGSLPWAAADPVEPLAALVDLVDGGDLPWMRDLNPYRLGATASDYGNQATFGQRDPYVPRTARKVDRRLKEALTPGSMVLLVGPSKSGKTRTAFEAAQRRWPDAHVLVPLVAHLSGLAAHPRLSTTDDSIIVWLDDLQRFFTSADPLTPALLDRLRGRPGPTIVLATLRQEARDRLRDATGELSRDTRSVLEAAATIELTHTSADPVEQAAAQAAYPDADLGGVGLAEELAHAPALLRAYDDTEAADPLQHRIVRVAIDWARAGVPRPIPEPDLVELAQDALWQERPDVEVEDRQAADAVKKARTALPGTGRAALLLTYPLPDRIRGYRPFSYLIAADDGQRGQTRPVPRGFWLQALQRCSPDEAHDIGTAAYYRREIDASLKALHRAAGTGDAEALRQIGFILAREVDPPDLPAARTAYEQAAEAGNTTALYNLGNLLSQLLDPPELDAARRAYEQAAAAGNTDALNNLGILLADRWDPPDLPAARTAYEQAAAAGNTGALNNLGILLADRWDPPDLPAARTAYEQAAAAGNTGALFNLGILLADRCDPPDLPAARTAYEQAAAAGHTDALFNLGILLATRWDPPDLPAARTAYEQAAEAGHTGALNNLGNLLSDRWDPPDLPAARTAYEQAAAAGHTDALFNLGILLATQWDPPDLPAARTAYEQAAEAGHTGALYNLGILLADRWDPPDLPAARTAYEQAAEAGNTGALYNLGILLSDRWDPPDLPAARTAYEQAAEAGHTGALLNLGNLLSDRWDPPDLPAARTAYEQAAAAGNTDALYNLGILLATQWDPPDLPAARTAYEQAAAAGNTDALLNLGNLLATRWDPPDLPAARTAYEQAAAAGHTDALLNLGNLLATQWDPPDLPAARTAYEQAAEAGHTDALLNLGILLADRWDPPDLPAARTAYEQAAAAGNARALNNLGILLADRWDPPDLPAARTAYEQAAAAGNTDALYNLGILLADRWDPPDLPAARTAYEQAAEAGNTDALINLGFAYAMAGDAVQARHAWEGAVDSGEPQTLAVAAVNLAPLLVLDGDRTTAQRLLRRAHHAGLQEAAEYADAINGDPAVRSRACNRLAAMADTDALNYRGLAALLGGEIATARQLWTDSQDDNDGVAPLLLRLTTEWETSDP